MSAFQPGQIAVRVEGGHPGQQGRDMVGDLLLCPTLASWAEGLEVGPMCVTVAVSGLAA